MCERISDSLPAVQFQRFNARWIAQWRNDQLGHLPRTLSCLYVQDTDTQDEPHNPSGGVAQLSRQMPISHEDFFLYRNRHPCRGLALHRRKARSFSEQRGSVLDNQTACHLPNHKMNSSTITTQLLCEIQQSYHSATDHLSSPHNRRTARLRLPDGSVLVPFPVSPCGSYERSSNSATENGYKSCTTRASGGRTTSSSGGNV